MSFEHFESTFKSFADIADLVRCFESGELARIRWTHHAHLIIGLWYISRFERSEAIELIRCGIKKHNASVGTIDSPTSGYHETITLAWAAIIRGYLEESVNKDPESFERYEEMIRSSSNPSTLFRYYSRDLLMSIEARGAWVEPDIMPLP